jgi:hypothetical protein
LAAVVAEEAVALAVGAVEAESAAVEACRGHLEVLWLARPAGFPEHPGHQSAVLPHSVVPAAGRRARQRDPAWVPGVGHGLRFNQEPVLRPCHRLVRGRVLVPAWDPVHQPCHPLALGLVPDWDPVHQPCHPLVLGLVQDWQRELALEQELPIGRQTPCPVSAVVTQAHGFPIRVQACRIAWQIDRKLSKTGEAA